jgi:hypothetical protein
MGSEGEGAMVTEIDDALQHGASAVSSDGVPHGR